MSILGPHVGLLPSPDSHFWGRTVSPGRSPRGTAVTSSKIIQAENKGRPAGTTVSLKGVQRAQRIGVLGFLSSAARKFHLISCFISLPLNQWNFPSLSFSQTKVANVEGEIAKAVNSSCLGLMAGTVQGPLGRTVCDIVT